MLALLALLPVLVAAGPIRKRDSNQLVFAGRDGKCISVQGGAAAVAAGQVTDGTPVVSVDCSGASTWDINRGSGSLLVSGTGYALDAGTTPGNNGALKVWTSYPGLYQQTWYYTDDQRIAITGGNQCLDEGDNGIQTYQCTTGNTNQIFYNKASGGGPTSSSSVSSTASSTSSSSGPTSTAIFPQIPTGVLNADPADGNGRTIRPGGRPDLCLTIGGGYAAIGTTVDINYCFAPNDTNSQFQHWDYTLGATGAVKLHGTDLCLDAGDNPANGSGMKIWTCYDGLLQQTWNFNNNVLALSNNQCLDGKKESTFQPIKPYGEEAQVQTWECSTNNDPYQVWVQH